MSFLAPLKLREGEADLILCEGSATWKQEIIY
jgi:hypothetical protein